MQRKIYVREIYFYIVCIIALIVFIIGLVNLADSIVNYVNPTTYISRPQIMPMYREQYRELSEQEINALVEEEMEASLKFEKNMALRGIIRGAVMLIISAPLFIFHWKKAQALWLAVNN
ncbi:MAG: hypothetical protein ACQEP2_02915 [Actinomycetota bacterium]